jgi:high-affinity iron transporter
MGTISRLGLLPVVLLLLPGVLLAQDKTAQTILNLLDYVSVEYPAFVQDGKVVDADEYAEQVEFSAQVRDLIATLPDNRERTHWQGRAAQLHALIQEKRDGAPVAALAREIQRGLIAAYGIPVAPKRAPDVAPAPGLYREYCLACHGSLGDGKGPQARGLDPAPSDFTDRGRASARTVYGLYNTISLGVAGTSMAAFTQLTSEQRWQLAFYVSGFSATDAERAAGEAAWKAGEGRSEFASLSPVVAMTPAEARSRGANAEAILAYLRSQPAAVSAGERSPIAFGIATMQQSLAAYQAGQRERAYQLAITAYLEGFELAESSVSSIDPRLRTRTEQAMMAYRNAVKGGSPAAQVEADYRAAVAALEEARLRTESRGISASANFISSLVIILREGLEAILVLAAMAAFLVKTGRREGLPWLHGGWIAALALGALTWVASSHLITISGAQREVTEGVTALLSSAVLLYVGFWLHSRSSAARWSAFIRQRIGGSTTWWGIALVAFLAVYREAFETVLFYQALWVQSNAAARSAVLGGFGAGLLALVVLAWLVIRLSVRLPLGLFFGASSALIAIMAVAFAGQGIAALQAAGRLAVSPLDVPSIPLLGIYPNLQGVALQVLLVALIAGAYLYLRAQTRRL